MLKYFYTFGENEHGAVKLVRCNQGIRIVVETAPDLGWVDWPMMHSDGLIVYDFPERIDQSLKDMVREAYMFIHLLFLAHPNSP